MLPVNCFGMTASYGRADENIEAFNELMADYDRRLERFHRRFGDGPRLARNVIESDDKIVARLRFRYEITRNSSADIIQRGGELFKRHPILAVGSALAFGFLAGIFIGRRSNQ